MCDCVRDYNEVLKDQGLALDLIMFFGDRKPAIKIPLMVIDESKKRKNKPKATLFGTFCPFCGDSIEDKEKE